MLNKKKINKKSSNTATFVEKYKDISQYRLNNGLTILYKQIKGTGVLTTNITYNVGARDEEIGETGLAHMLEHMLFKPTQSDLQKKIDSGAMQFERETGCILNANTWKDRTTYFFSYPKEYFNRALEIEADRMQNVVLSEKEFTPERGNVLSEFDMYFGDPQFALSMEMISSAFHSHPYGHETIGFRQDIEAYTPELLKAFYEKYYNPQNATLTIVGDIDESIAITTSARVFGSLKTKYVVEQRKNVVEPKQEGLRRIEIKRDALSNVVALGVKHEGFPSNEWFKTSLAFSMLTSGQDSILYKWLVDTNLASKVESSVEPSTDTNLAMVYVTLSQKANHVEIEKIVRETIQAITPKDVVLHYKKLQQKILTDELIGRESSLSIAMELTEYISAGVWKTYFDTEAIIKSITHTDIVKKMHTLFKEENMTIGYFIGKK